MPSIAALIVDGAYFSQGAEKCSKLSKGCKFTKSKQNFEFLITMIE